MTLDSGNASAGINGVSCERFVPFDAEFDPVNATYLLATAADIHRTSYTRTSMTVSSIICLGAPPAWKGCNVYHLCSIPASD